MPRPSAASISPLSPAVPSAIVGESSVEGRCAAAKGGLQFNAQLDASLAVFDGMILTERSAVQVLSDSAPQGDEENGPLRGRVPRVGREVVTQEPPRTPRQLIAVEFVRAWKALPARGGLARNPTTKCCGCTLDA